MGQERIKKTALNKKAKAEVKPVDKEKAEKMKKDIDDLIDEIDKIIGENSEEFMKSYIQHGGE